MNKPEALHTIAWYRAMTLWERAASPPAAAESDSSSDGDQDRAARRLQRWKSQPPFSEDSLFAQRLAVDGISEGQLLRLLGEPVEALAERVPDPPDWLRRLDAAFTPRALDGGRHSAPLEALRGRDAAGFLIGIQPLIAEGRGRFRAGIEALARTHRDLPFDPGSVEELMAGKFADQLLQRLMRTMMLELNVARLEGVLEGDTSEERFQSFLRRLCQAEVRLALVQEYPVLARQLLICIDQWIASSLELLTRLCDDWPAIQKVFCEAGDPGVLTEVSGATGDRHRDGRAVRLLRFDSGLRLVYKPRSLAVDLHFQQLLSWLNERGADPPFRPLTVLNRDNYGWVECIAAEPCASSEAVHRFYERVGGYLALFYALCGVDLHQENLIAMGEHPIMIDLETLFQPSLAEGEDVVGDSVLRVGLLPQRLRTQDTGVMLDVSGVVGIRDGQPTPFAVPSLEGEGTDEMRLVRRRVPMAASSNRPTLAGEDVDPLQYSGAIQSGFAACYRLLRDHREALLADDGPLARFAHDELRVMVRGTQTYARLVEEAFHPDVLRNALDRDRLFDWLWLGVSRSPELRRVIAAECRDLHNGDTPSFTMRPESLDLWTSTQERIRDYFARSGMSLVRKRVEGLSEKDLDDQMWFIRASLASPLEVPARSRSLAERMTESPSEVARGRLLTTAMAVGDRVAALAVDDGRGVTWSTLGTDLERRMHRIEPLGTDLYAGLPGVALFLAYLGAETGESAYTALAQRTLATLRRQVEETKSAVTFIGGFVGWGGLIYTLSHLAMLWKDPALLAEAEAIVALLPPLIERDEVLDVVVGAAGCIGGLLSLYRCAPSPQTLSVAIQCGDRLLARAVPAGPGIGWMGLAAGQQPLSGFSHGGAGFAWALLQLGALTGEERFHSAALGAIAYERTLFSEEKGNWRDLRPWEDAPDRSRAPHGAFVTGWCHGAPGIGLARLQTLAYLDDDAVRAEIAVALKTTLALGFGRSHSLCHGDLGNLEFVLQASQVLDEPLWREQVQCLTTRILDSIEREGCVCGSSGALEVPGLMVGLAGIGYQLLRLADPARVPSVLVLAPPL